jgi:hypothetical protein
LPARRRHPVSLWLILQTPNSVQITPWACSYISSYLAAHPAPWIVSFVCVPLRPAQIDTSLSSSSSYSLRSMLCF